VGGVAVLFAFNPAEHALYPRCAFNSLTGLLCPGCGGLRAMHQLLHGNLAAAWALNPLAVLLVPASLLIGLAMIFRTWLPLRLLRFSGRVAWIVIAGLAAFALLRNLW
jgi:hypothetical protein